jgi:hypothetical protein
MLAAVKLRWIAKAELRLRFKVSAPECETLNVCFDSVAMEFR